jgi:HK97 gp10 family phage protein
VAFVSAKWENREQVMKRLRRVAPEVETEVAAQQLKSGRLLAERIASRAPRRTGRYAESIQADRLANNPRGNRNLVGISQTKDPNAVGIYAEFYWQFLEFGTVDSHAQPHVFPTYRAMKKSIKAGLTRAMGRGIKKARSR